MLIGFTVKNFMSFFEENIFSMVADKDKSWSEINTYKFKKLELLKSVFIYGANSSGKTNFIKALDYMKAVITEDISNQSKLIRGVDFFSFSTNSSEIPSAFEIEFMSNQTIFTYGFEILHREVCLEYLFKKDQRKVCLFKRMSPDCKNIYISKELEGVKHLTKNTRNDNLFLYWANNGNNDIAMTVFNWIEKIKIFYHDTESDNLTATYTYLSDNDQRKKKVLNLLQKADPSITDFEIKQNGHQKNTTNGEDTSFQASTERCLFTKDYKIANLILTPHICDSSGTQKIFEMAGPILTALEEGDVVFIDEMDSRLHPILVKNIVSLFNSISDNPKNAQLICNTHDVLLLEEGIRRDQIYFTDKNEYNVSSLYSLSDFKGIRKENKLNKLYLLGAFGAIPKYTDDYGYKNE